MPPSFSHFTYTSFPRYHHLQCPDQPPKILTPPHTTANIISLVQISLSVYVYFRSRSSRCLRAIQQVEDVLFRVHRYFFGRDSSYFRLKLPQPSSPGDSSLKGSSDNNPLVLDDVLKVDFERFLWVFYNPYACHSHTPSRYLINLPLQKVLPVRCKC